MSAQGVLLFGIASVAAVVGYMAGGSATPVANVAIPAVFGLVVTAVGLLHAGQPGKELVELVQAAEKNEHAARELLAYRARSASAPVRVGLALVVFAVVYLAAATVGAKVRIERLLAPLPQAQAFPWEGAAMKPPTLAAALEWMAVQTRLTALGYGRDDIAALYEIQQTEWTHEADRGRVAAQALDGLSTPDGKGESKKPAAPASDLLRQYWEQGAPAANPFAHQPKRDTLDRLLMLERGMSKGAMPG